MQEQSISPESPGVLQPATPPLQRYDEHELRNATVRRGASVYRSRGARAGGAEQLVKALGWLSIGLGLAQLLAPRQVSRAIGIGDSLNTMRALGARELTSGIGILAQRRPAGWLWSRVAGDAMDLALLGNAARKPGVQRNRLNFATAAVVGVAVLDLLVSAQEGRREAVEEGRFSSGAMKVDKIITVNRPPEECYRFWRDFENFPRFMKHLESVRVTDENRTAWKAKAPAGMSVEWEAEVTADEPGRMLAWHSVSGSVDNIGSVRFLPAPGGRGTLVHVELQYSPPGGAAGAMVAKLFGEEPSMQIDEDLRRFKWLIETGEIPTTIGQPSGPRGAMNRLLWRKGEPG